MGAHLLLAVSGGADSLAMTCILKYLARDFDFELSACSINHQIRDEAEQDALHAQKICRDLNIVCQIETFDAKALAKQKKIGLEESSRLGRYEILEACRQKLNADFIALGHHNHDLSEDVFMRIIRGCGWPALGGMKARDDKRHLIRPLLWANPDDLKRFLVGVGIEWQEDSSNNCLLYLRNRIRKNILPEIRKENPSFDDATWHIHELARLDEKYWESEIKKFRDGNCWVESNPNHSLCIAFPKQFLEGLHQALRLRIYMYALGRIGLGNSNTGKAQGRFETISKLDQALIKSGNKKIFQFGKKIVAKLDSKWVIFCESTD